MHAKYFRVNELGSAPGVAEERGVENTALCNYRDRRMVMDWRIN